MAWVGAAALLVLLGWLATLVLFRREVARAWREPVVRHPVLIVESDDWGPGPAEDAAALRAIAARLGEFRDAAGRRPVMTLGIVLTLADTEKMRAAGDPVYADLRLDDPRAAEVLGAIKQGIAQGVFEIQLHGMAHYWPDTLMRAARTDDRVAAWLRQSGWARTEQLPAALQSRWTDAATLPSRPHDPREAAAAVTEEVGEFARVFGIRPAVVVPPTFVWTDEVEPMWARQGIEILVCPAKQFIARGARGELIDAGKTLRNGERSGAGLGCVVRDIYFEPERGHTAAATLAQIESSFRCGRAALLETHRANFTHDPAVRDRSLDELRALVTRALERWPDLCFIGTARLGRALMDMDSEWVDMRWLRRTACTLQRLRQVPRCGRLLRLTGLALFAEVLARLTPASGSARPGALRRA